MDPNCEWHFKAYADDSQLAKSTSKKKSASTLEGTFPSTKDHIKKN